MNTKLLMIASSFTLGILGLAATFFPSEIFAYFNISNAGIATLLLQVAGALYVGFAMMNWMAKGNIIGGIYSKPLAMGNFTHYLVAALALIKGTAYYHEFRLMIMLAVLYTVFAILFGWLAFMPPSVKNNKVS